MRVPGRAERLEIDASVKAAAQFGRNAEKGKGFDGGVDGEGSSAGKRRRRENTGEAKAEGRKIGSEK